MALDDDLDLGQLAALDAVVTEGTFDGAARRLHVTPSAISQRIRALEVATGRVLLVRSKPVHLTESGEPVLRLARQIGLLTAEARRELTGSVGGPDDGTEPVEGPVRLPIAVNADSMATWFLPALAPLAGEFSFELHRVDQERTGDLLRGGRVMAAVTTRSTALPGCSSTRLGTMRYRPVASRAFVRRWLPDGATTAALRRAPVVVYDNDDDLQHAWLRTRAGRDLHPPVHHVPSADDFATAVRLGFGWGMLPDQLRRAALVPLVPDDEADADAGRVGDVVLHWQQWRLRSAALDRVSAAVVAAAAAALD
ncbi:LysR family transcriptional regulator ArgP [Kineococcus gynurae]|uniref:LysR family transcriptional regulator ArgP n=1 Tax=Kineococcus gynurae TaxID=452979 RepID=A0ABV5LT52_9ACTN